MEQGASIRVSPSWLEGTVIILDIQWDTDNLSSPAPSGGSVGRIPFWQGQVATRANGSGIHYTILDIVGSSTGIPRGSLLRTWMISTSLRRAARKARGRLPAGLVPTTHPPAFDWKVP